MLRGTSAPSRSANATITRTLLALALAAGLAAHTGCSREETAEKGPAVQEAVSTGGSACVSCHTDKERLVAETANLPKPKASALTSGRG